MTKNPFNELGLSPEAFKGLDAQEIREVTKVLYRKLQLIHHPDKTGDNTRSTELNEANTMLKDTELFEHFKNEFMTPQPLEAKIAKLEKTLADKKEVLESQYKRFMDYMECFSGFTSSTNAFNIRFRVLHLEDTAVNMNTSYQARMEMAAVTKSKRAKKRYQDLAIDKDGNLSYLVNGQKTKRPHKRLIGCVDQSFLRHPDDPVAVYGVDDFLKVIQGTVTSRDQELEIQGYLTSRGGVESVQDVKPFINRLSPESFYPVFQYLIPSVKQGLHLFSINKDKDGVYFALEGRIRNISKL